MKEEIFYVNKVINLGLIAVGFILFAQLLVILPLIESWLYPVVTGFTVTDIHAVQGNLYISGIMEKVRDCTPLDITVWDQQKNLLLNVVEVDFTPDVFHNVELVLRQRPSGFQAWGPWGIEFTTKAHESLVFQASHRCHPLWTTDTTLLNVSYEDLPNNIRFFSNEDM